MMVLRRIKSLVQGSALLFPIRLLFWLVQAHRESRYMAAVAPSMGMAVLSVVAELSNLAQAKDSSTLFVLGNGASVNTLRADDFLEIGQGVSVGVNGWPVHPFVPDFYAFEFWSHGTEPDRELEFLLELANRKRRSGTKPRFFFLRPGSQSCLRTVPEIPVDVRTRSALFGRGNFLSLGVRALRTDLYWLLLLLRCFRAWWSVLPDNGSSVIRLLCAGVIAGFSRIVISGVDLNGSSYFWYEEQFVASHGDFRARVERSAQDGLATNLTLDRPFASYEFIAVLADVAARFFGTEILIAGEGSSLTSALGHYDFPARSKSGQPLE